MLCHGVGADGHDLIDLAPHWGAGLPHAAFAAPDAPEAYRHGAPLAASGGQHRRPRPGADGRRRCAWPGRCWTRSLTAELARLGLPADAYALMGFSQGAMMVLYAGLRRPTAPRAILAYSGALIAPQDLPRSAATRPRSAGAR